VGEDAEILQLTGRLNDHLNSRGDQLKAFYRYQSQLEGWLKGELLWFLDREKTDGRLSNFEREVLLPRRHSKQRFDFKLAFRTGEVQKTAWIELKHWLIGYQKDSHYNCQFYFGDPTSIGIKPDVEKLASVRSGNKYLWILMTQNPGENDWASGMKKFNEKFRPLHVDPLTQPTNFPDFYFLGLLKA